MTVVLQLQEGRVITKENSLELIRDYACNRIRHNKNCLIVNCGGTGSGKSLSSLKLAEMIQEKLLPDTPLTAENNIVFKGSDFISKIQGSNILPSRSTIIWDEVSVFGLNSRRSMSNINVMLNNVFNTFRHQNYVVILTTPDFANIDVVVRKLLHIYIKTCKIDFKSKLNQLEVQYMQYNPRFGRIYYHTFQVMHKEGDRKIMKHFFAQLPSEQLVKEYEEKKKIFTDELNKMVMLKITEMEEEESKTDKQKAEDRIERNKKQLTAKQAEVHKLLNEGFTQTDCAEALGVNQSCIAHIARSIRGKGYDITDSRTIKTNKDEFDEVFKQLKNKKK